MVPVEQKKAEDLAFHADNRQENFNRSASVAAYAFAGLCLAGVIFLNKASNLLDKVEEKLEAEEG